MWVIPTDEWLKSWDSFTNDPTTEIQKGIECKKKFDDQNKKQYDLELKYGLSNLENEIYEIAKMELDNQIMVLKQELNKTFPEISKQGNQLVYSTI